MTPSDFGLSRIESMHPFTHFNSTLTATGLVQSALRMPLALASAHAALRQRRNDIGLIAAASAEAFANLWWSLLNLSNVTDEASELGGSGFLFASEYEELLRFYRIGIASDFSKFPRLSSTSRQLWNDAFLAAFAAVNESFNATNQSVHSVSLSSSSSSLAVWLHLAISELSAAASIAAACRSVFDLSYRHDASQQSNCAMVDFALKFASQELEVANMWSDSIVNNTNDDVADDVMPSPSSSAPSSESSSESSSSTASSVSSVSSSPSESSIFSSPLPSSAHHCDLRVGVFSNRWALIARFITPVLARVPRVSDDANTTVQIICYTALHPIELERQVFNYIPSRHC